MRSPQDIRSAAAVDVLVVDQEEPRAELTANALRDSGLSARVVDTPIGATRAIVKNEAHVIVLNADMPGIRGDRLISLLRGIDRLRELRVVMASAAEHATVHRLANRAGADGVYCYGEDVTLLVDMVRSLLGRRTLSGTRRRSDS